MSAIEARKYMFEHEIADESDVTETVQAPVAEVPIAEAPSTEAPSSETPSWFTRTYEATPEELAERYQQQHDELMAQNGYPKPGPEAYDAYKRRLEERFRMAQTMVDPDHAPSHHGRPSRPSVKAPKRQTRAPFAPRGEAKREPSQRLSVSAALAFTLLACAIGGGAGYTAANPGGLSKMMSGTTTLLATLMSGGTSQSPSTTLQKVEPVARIAVNDVSGPVNGLIPLGISTFPTSVDTPIAVRITGLPPEAYITKGTHVADGAWLVKSAEIAKAELVVPRSTTSLLGLEVAALDEKTGQEAAPPTQMNVALDLNAVPLPGAVPPPEPNVSAQSNDVRVMPVSAEPDQGFNKPVVANTVAIPTPLQTTNAEGMNLIAKGQMLLKNGDLISARQYFLKAHAMKLPEAAYFVGQTYDPATFDTLRVVGLQPDPQLAAEWYGKAAAQGVAAAEDALSKLSSR